MKEDFKLTRRKFIGLAALTLLYGCTHVNTTNLIHFTKSENLEAIVTSKSSEYQVVMFGEQHGRYNKDNDFVVRLLPKLKSQGFNYLALEVERHPYKKDEIFVDYISGKLSRVDITQKNIAKLEWVYTKGETTETIRIVPDSELIPHIEGWLDIIDTAKKENMKIICYDANRTEYNSSEERDEQAFKNLKDLVFDKDPNARIVAYCGASHLSKQPIAKSGKKLGYHINKYTNGNTLTISLVGRMAYIEHCDIIIDLDKNKCMKNNK